MAKDKKEDTQKLNLEQTTQAEPGDTQKLKTDTQRLKTSRKKSKTPGEVKKPKLWRVILGGVFITLLLGCGSGYLGYNQGITDRLNAQNEKILSQAALQYQYGIQQMNAGNYELARTHFEYVLENYPSFPGLTDQYTAVMVKIAQESLPTATPAPTSTPDNRNIETLFAQAQQEVQSQQWASAVNTLESLRNADYTYRTIEVDGLYYTALRYRAVDMILSEGNLEEGMYYLSVLEKYAPLDKDAVNYSTVVRLYLTGASYWELNWETVVSYFEQLYASLPSLYDGTMTASERYYYAVQYYADELMDDGDECNAEYYYNIALSMTPTDDLQSKYNKAYKICHPPTATPTEEEEEEDIVEEEEDPTEDPTEEVTEEVPEVVDENETEQ